MHAFITAKTNTILKEKGIPVHIGKITLLLNGKIGVNELAMISPSNDTIMYAGKLSVDISPLPLFSKKVFINNTSLEDAVINIVNDSVTNEINLISAFVTQEKKVQEPEIDTAGNKMKWDIIAHSIQFKNVSFKYSDVAGGILVKEKLERARIDFDHFSLMQKQIDVGSLEINKPVGMVKIWKGTRKSDNQNSTSPEWKFSARNLIIHDLLFSLAQPNAGQQIDVALKGCNISLNKLDLAKSEILVGKIELDKPEVNFSSNYLAATKTESETDPSTFSIPVLPWTIMTEKFEINDGSINYLSTNKTETETLEKWLPLQGLKAHFDNIQITPAGYKLNLEKITFNLSETLYIDSGSLNFTSDLLQNMGLSLNLSALLNDKKGWFVKNQHINFNTKIEGNTAALKINEFAIASTTGLSFNARGSVQQPFQIQNSTCDLRFASGSISRNMLIPAVNHFSPKTILPKFQPFTISGNVKNSLSNPVFGLKLNSKSGQIEASGNYDVQNSMGELDATFTEVLLAELMGETFPENITGKVYVNGGLNRYNMPEGEANIVIDSVRYKNKTTRNISLIAEAVDNETNLNIQANDSSLNLDLQGLLFWDDEKTYSGNINGTFDIDVFALNLMTKPLSAKGNIECSFGYSPGGINASLNLQNSTISNKNASVIIEKTEFQFNSTDSLIESNFSSGFLDLNFESRASLSDFKNAYDSTNIRSVINIDSTNFLNLDAISNLSFFKLDATFRNNPVFDLFYPDSALNFSDIKLDIVKADKESKVEATITTKLINYNLVKSYNSNLLARIEHDRLVIRGSIDSIRANELKFGKAGLDFEVLPASIVGNMNIFDSNDSILHQIGFEASRENDEVIFKSATPAWLLNKIPWTLSPPQFLTFNISSKNVQASLDMHSEGKHILISGNSSDQIEFDLKNIEFSNLAIPGLIGIVPEGKINGNIKYSKKEFNALELDLEMLDMKWSGIQFKKLAASGYLHSDSTGIPDSDFLVTADDSLSLSVQIESNSKTNETHVKSKFNNLYFQLFEPFINQYAKGLHGISSGEIELVNKNGKNTLNGEIDFKKFGLEIIPLHAKLSIPDNKINISDNQFLFKNFTVIDSLNRPLTVNGNILYVNNNDIKVDLKLNANKIQLMNTPESSKAPLFGSLQVNSALNIYGSIFSPTIKGNIELERGTNLTYQLVQDLSVQGSQNDVVFATITDSLFVIYPKGETESNPTKMPNIEATISINPKSILNVKIADLYDVDITIAGNGLLNYTMLPNNTTSLNGDFVINSGDCKLKITGWPLKNFNITKGSSFKWNGSIEDPTLNLEATSKVKGSYANPIDKKSRVVDFIVSMQIKNQLSNLDIIFDIQSSDQYIMSVINSFSTDEKMWQAINLLLFGTINIPGSESSSNYLSSQINSFWESQLNSLSEAKMNKTKLSFGIDTYNELSAEGSQQDKTSFTYEMERKFMNDRATVKVSGKLNDYNEGTYKTNSLFENFIFEYALDSLNTRNIKLYQKRDYEDMLEGEVVKHGVGFLYRKSYKKLNEIWQRGKRKRLEEQPKMNN